MHLIFLLAKTFPYWAVPVAVIFWQLGVHFMHRRSPQRFTCWGMALWIVVVSCAWIYYRGDLYADVWVSGIFGS